MKYWIFLLVGLMVACTRPTLEQLFLQARTQARNRNYETAECMVRKGLSRCDKKTQVERYWAFRLLQIKCLRRMNIEKACLGLRDFRDMPPTPALLGRFKFYQSRLLACADTPKSEKENLEEKRRLLESGRELALQAGDFGLLSEIELDLADKVYDQQPKVERHFISAINHAREAGDIYLEANARVMQAVFLINKYRWSDCAETLEAIPREEEEVTYLKPFFLINLGVSLNRLGRLKEAALVLGETVALSLNLEYDELRFNALGELGNNHFYQQSYAKAAEYYEEAFQVAEQSGGKHENQWLWAMNVAYVQVERKNWLDAGLWHDKAAKLYQISLKSGAQNTNNPLLQLVQASIADGQGNHEDAKKLLGEIIENGDTKEIRWEAHANLGSLYNEEGEHKFALEQYDLAIDLIEKATISEETKNAIGYFSRLIKFYQDYVELLVKQSLHDKAFYVAASSRARLLRLSALSKTGKDPTYAGVSKSCRGGGAVYLSYWIAPERSFLWVFRPDGKHDFVALPAKNEIMARLEAYESFLANDNNPMNVVNGHQPAGEWLYDNLIKPAKIKRGTRVILETDGELARLNLETLPVYGTENHYWLEDVILSITPSLAILKPTRPGGPGKSMLVIGDPDVVNPDFPKLPGVGEEINFAKKAFASWDPLHVFTGAEATPEAYLNRVGGYSVTLFAAHGESSRKSPLDSAIVLSQLKAGSYKLTVRQIMDNPPTSETVIITSCRSAGSTTHGEGLVGFSWAFLHAGAHHVVAGLWDLKDRATKRLMGSVYHDLAEGKNLARSLREAKLNLVRSGVEEPSYWGPIQLFSRDNGLR